MHPEHHPELRQIRRARALIRDERSLTAAIDHQARLRFDADAARLLRDRTEDMLETLAAIGHDEEFWELIAQGQAVPADRLERLRRLDPDALPVLLEACGYHTPPPPPAGELVDEVMTELVAALHADPGEHIGERIDRARSGLFLTVSRLRRQLGVEVESPAQGSCLRTIGRRAAQVARLLAPSAVAAVAGVLVDPTGLTSATFFSLAAAAAVKKVVEDGVMEGSAWLIAHSFLAEARPESAEEMNAIGGFTGMFAPVLPHGEALSTALHELGRLAKYEMPRRDAVPVEAVARRHVARMVQLIGDHHTADQYVVDAAARLVSAVDAIDCACPPGGPHGDARLDAIRHAMGALDQLLGAAALNAAETFAG